MGNNTDGKDQAIALTEKKIALHEYKNEKNLMQFPFCSTSKRKRINPIVYQSHDGFSLEVTANNTYGMVKIWDFDIVRYGLSKLDEITNRTGFFIDYVTFTAYECLKALNRDPHAGTNVKWLKDALDRLASTTYKTNIFNNENQKKVQGFTLAKYEYIESEGGVDKIKLTFDNLLIETIKNNNTLLKINTQLIREEAGIKKRLLELVAVNIDNNEWQVELGELQKLCANDWEIRRFKYEISTYNHLPWEISFQKVIDETIVKFKKRTV